MRKFNELEGVVTGLIHKHQPCTAYSVRKELKASPSSHWQASAGAIYPLLARLENEGFIKSAEDGADGRGRKLLALTSIGKKTLKVWIKDIVTLDILSEVSDPVRSRIFFLQAFTKEEQIQFTESTLIALEKNLIDAQEYLKSRPASNGQFDHLGAIGGVINSQSRIEFMKIVLTSLASKNRT